MLKGKLRYMHEPILVQVSIKNLTSESQFHHLYTPHQFRYRETLYWKSLPNSLLALSSQKAIV